MFSVKPTHDGKNTGCLLSITPYWMLKFGWLAGFILGAILNNSIMFGFVSMFGGWIYVVYAFIFKHTQFIPSFKTFFGM